MQEHTLLSGQFVQATRLGAVATVRFTREAARNALSAALLRELDQVVRALRLDAEVCAVVLTGGNQVFCAGADKNDPEIFSATDTVARRHGLLARADIARAWEDLPQVTIAAIEGYAVGGGLTLALCCDFRVISESAFLYAPEIQLGLSYGWNTIPRLTALLGPALTKRLVLLGEKIPADQAFDWRLVDYVTAAGSANDRAQQLAQEIASKPRLAMEINKRAINAATVGLSHLVSHADTDQSILCRLALEDAQRRQA